MPLKNCYIKLENIAKLSEENDKQRLLKAYLVNPVFAQVIRAMLAEDVSYDIHELPEPRGKMGSSSAKEGDIIKYLEKLAKKENVSNNGEQQLADMSAANVETYEVVRRIIAKDSCAGFGLPSVKKVAPWLLDQTSYQRHLIIAKMNT